MKRRQRLCNLVGAVDNVAVAAEVGSWGRKRGPGRLAERFLVDHENVVLERDNLRDGQPIEHKR